MLPSGSSAGLTYIYYFSQHHAIALAFVIQVKKRKEEKPQVVAASPAKTVSSLQSFGDVPVVAVAVEEIVKTTSNDSGPRQTGARRSTERKRRKTTSGTEPIVSDE